MSLYSMEEFGSSAVENFPGKTLNIKKNMEKLQQEELTKILQKHSAAFAGSILIRKVLTLRLASIISILRKTIDQSNNLKEG